MKALILAGSKGNKTPLLGYTNKALLPIRGKIMVQYIIDALRGSAFIDGIAIIGDENALAREIQIDSDKDIILPEKEQMIDNVVKGLEHFQREDKVLIITADIPFITPAAIDDFIKASLDSKGDLTYPIISKEAQEEAFPQMKRTYIKLREGTFTGGNMFLVNPAIVDRCIDMARYMMEHRKKPWKMAKMLGISFLARLLMGTLTLKGLEKRVAHLLNIEPKAIISSYAEVGNDVDKPSDVEYAEKYLSLLHHK